MAAVASLSDDDASSMATTVPGAVVVVIDDETDVFESAPDIESPKSQVFESNPDMYPDTFPDTAMQDNVMLSNVDGVFKEESMSISDTLLETALQDVFVLSMVDDALKEESMNIPDTFLDTARPDNVVPRMVEEALKEESPSIPDIVRQDEVALGESLSIDSYSAAWLRRDNDVTQSEAFPDFINKHYNPNPHRSRSPDRYYLKHGPAASLSAAPASARFPFDIHRFENLGEACRYALVGRSRHGAGALCSMLDGTVSYDDALTFARQKVQARISSGCAFYIGISEAPQRRFDQHLDKNSTWEEQVVLVEAANSSTTASLEIALLALFGQRGNCTNASGGGECRSSGSPHYVYLLIGNHHRRSR